VGKTITGIHGGVVEGILGHKGYHPASVPEPLGNNEILLKQYRGDSRGSLAETNIQPEFKRFN
jgi:hypothetical protein